MAKRKTTREEREAEFKQELYKRRRLGKSLPKVVRIPPPPVPPPPPTKMELIEAQLLGEKFGRKATREAWSSATVPLENVDPSPHTLIEESCNVLRADARQRADKFAFQVRPELREAFRRGTSAAVGWCTAFCDEDPLETCESEGPLDGLRCGRRA